MQNLKYQHPQYYNINIDLWLDSLLDDINNRYQCVDNVRIAELTSQSELEEYEYQKSKGCCGAIDTEVQHRESGRRFLLGFNYGH
jgi:hypothetical protein